MINYLLATQRVESTIGVTLNRLLRYMKLAGAYLIATTLGAGTGFAAGSYLKVSGAAGLIGAVAGFGLCAYFIHWSRRARLYQYWVPHLSLFGRLAEGLTIPVGKQQLEMGREKVQRLFETPAEIFSIYEKSADVVCALFINRFNLDSVSALPVIGDGLKILMTRIVSPLRDALLTLSLSDEVNNPWQTLQENLVLVSNRAAEIQRSILWVVLIQIVGF
ncbi:MAG TPA: hypothetical protein ENJ32_06340, partial [Crenotrichaceae bacterium]|nr:hypothetical protein [Crenotrichaceae bacterium]